MPSVVWGFFKKTSAGPQCLLCNDLRRRRDSSTKTMWVHLKLKHVDIYRRLRGSESCSSQTASKSVELHEPPALEGRHADGQPTVGLSVNCWPPSPLFAPNFPSAASIFAPFLNQNAGIPQPPANPLLNAAFNNFFLEFYLQLFRNGAHSKQAAMSRTNWRAEVLEKSRPEASALHWAVDGPNKAVSPKKEGRGSCKKCKVGLCVDCFQRFPIAQPSSH
ncbi:hypothetical protein M3Y99_01322000 [Aphelenchoides fujianensis]|nr:hypothetical protein M3Y99_01322000 [Aphelenchoides fujianensis]